MVSLKVTLVFVEDELVEPFLIRKAKVCVRTIRRCVEFVQIKKRKINRRICDIMVSIKIWTYMIFK